MIQNKIRTKRLNYIIESGVTYIIVPRSSLNEEKHREIQESAKQPAIAAVPVAASPKTSVGMVISLYQKENHHLKLKIKELEGKIDRLINDKEDMLIAERTRIEDIYTAKDEQLKSILEVLSTKLMLSNANNTVHDVDVAQPAALSIEPKGIIELKRYLKFIGVGSEDRKLVRRRFAERFGSDVRIIQREGEFYVDLSKYDYTDLL